MEYIGFYIVGFIICCILFAVGFSGKKSLRPDEGKWHLRKSKRSVEFYYNFAPRVKIILFKICAGLKVEVWDCRDKELISGRKVYDLYLDDWDLLPEDIFDKVHFVESEENELLS